MRPTGHTPESGAHDGPSPTRKRFDGLLTLTSRLPLLASNIISRLLYTNFATTCIRLQLALVYSLFSLVSRFSLPDVLIRSRPWGVLECLSQTKPFDETESELRGRSFSSPFWKPNFPSKCVSLMLCIHLLPHGKWSPHCVKNLHNLSVVVSVEW